MQPSGGQKQGSQKYYIRTVGRMRKNSPLHCCNCVPCTQTGVQSGSVMLQKDLNHLPVFAKPFEFVVSISLMSANIALYWLVPSMHASTHPPTHPFTVLQPLLGPGLPQKAPPSLPIPSSSPLGLAHIETQATQPTQGGAAQVSVTHMFDTVSASWEAGHGSTVLRLLSPPPGSVPDTVYCARVAKF